jgi:hypothetical protein
VASLFTETFEGGTNGAAVTSGNTNFASVTGSTLTFASTPTAPQGTLSLSVVAAAAATVYGQSTVTVTGVFYRRVYVYPPATVTGTFDMVATRGSNSPRNRLRLNTNRTVSLLNGTAVVWTSTTALPAGQWSRIEFRVDNTAGQQQARLYIGANPHTATVTEDSGDRTYNQGTIDTIRLGQLNSATTGSTTIFFDAVADDDAAWPGPITTAPAALTATFTGTGTLSATVTALNNAITATITGTGTLTASIYGIPVPPPSVLRQFHEWVMFARGIDYAPTVPLPILSAQIIVRHMGVGKAVVSTDYTEDRWQALGPGNGLTIWRDGRQEFTGLVSTRSITWDRDSGQAALQVECEGDEGHLADRLVFPDPMNPADAQTVNDYWTFTGTASSAMRRLISDQAGPTCRPDRQISGLVLGADPGRGTSRTWRSLFDAEGSVLGTLASFSVASGSDLGLRLTAAPGSLTIDITAPRDLASSAVFSADLSNLVGFEYSESAPTVTHALSAGSGTLKARIRRLATTFDPLALQWRRQRWSYVDQSDTGIPSDLVNAAQDALAQGGPTVSVSTILADSDAATYGVDWQLGDRVTIYVGLPGQTKPAVVSDVVREVLLEIDASGAETIRPAIGTYDAKALLPTPTQRQLANIGAQLANLKRK